MAALGADLAAYRYKQLILVLQDPARRREYPTEDSYYLGEALRLRNEPGDLDAAEREYTIALEGAPLSAPPYRARSGGITLPRGADPADHPSHRDCLTRQTASAI